VSGTLAVNLVGSFLLGAVLEVGGEAAVLLLGAGLAGALTTFSTFAVDLDVLRAERRRRALAVYAVVTVLGSVGAVVAGAWVAAGIAG
jgi:CrcB protein